MGDETTQLIVGDAVAAGMEQYPRRRWGRRKKKSSSLLTHCENCGAELRGPYCSACGQAAIDYRRSFRHVFVDVLDSFLNWDSKFFATIAWLIARPWHLTDEFLAGRRVRYVHPLRLYLLASILFFFAVNYWAKAIHLDASKLSPRDRTEIEAELKNEDLPPHVRAKIEQALKTETPPSAVIRTEPESKAKDSSPEPRANTQGELKKHAGTSDKGDFGPLLQLDSDKRSTPFEKWIETRAKEKIGERGSKAELFLKTLISNLPYMMLCCIPLFAFVLKILYIRRRVFYIDHLVYALHIHTFAYVGIMIIGLATIALNRTAAGALAGWMIALLWLAFAMQIFFSIRRVYRQGWFLSTFKFVVGGIAYLTVLVVALAATFFITLALP